jgi:hypothetical protein
MEITNQKRFEMKYKRKQKAKLTFKAPRYASFVLVRGEHTLAHIVILNVHILSERVRRLNCEFAWNLSLVDSLLYRLGIDEDEVDEIGI